ncbi:MAG TPA: response regulator, partial [Chthoniobacterales bacterium]|nr:response regulator [Chthoniobacterales bacterium]
MPASQESPAGTASSVLLVEEYDALAAAITSALKKFAPRHRVRAVESLAEAEASMAETSSQLVIVDFDPPRSDAVNFVERISAANPNARFLAIASGVPEELNGERYGANAVQFIEKPFELAEFGAAVQALLGPWTNATSGDSRGTLRDLNVRDLIPLQCLNSATAVLHLRSTADRTGEIHFLDGQITHAVTGNFTGPGALHQMIRWKNPRARETERLLDAPRTIHGPWPQVFLEALRKTAVTTTEESPAPPVAPDPRESAKKVIKSGKKIVIIDDTEMLLIFVEDTLAIADPNLQIVTALTGNEGVRRAEVMMPDLVLLDYSLPDLRGDQVCERLLQNEVTARIPVVMMSGHVSEMAAAARRYPNIVATIAKPFMSEALVALVSDTLTKGLLVPTVPVRQGNGKKPAKKNGAAVSPKEVGEKHPTSAPAVAPPSSVQPAPPAPAPPAPPPAAPPPPAPAAHEIAEKLPAVSPAPAAPLVTAARAAAPAPPVAIPQPQISLPRTPEIVERQPSAAPAQPIAPQPTYAEPLSPAPSALIASAPPPLPVSSALPAVNGSSVVVGLGMEVIGVQFTPRFQIGTIRARPIASTLSLVHWSAPEEDLLAGFEIGTVELDVHGRIQSMRVVPTRQPARRIEARSRFAISDLVLVNQNAAIRMTAGPAAPMTMQLVAMFRVSGVELSDRFEVEQLVLEPAGNRVRVSLEPHSHSSG